MKRVRAPSKGGNLHARALSVSVVAKAAAALLMVACASAAPPPAIPAAGSPSTSRPPPPVVLTGPLNALQGPPWRVGDHRLRSDGRLRLQPVGARVIAMRECGPGVLVQTPDDVRFLRGGQAPAIVYTFEERGVRFPHTLSVHGDRVMVGRAGELAVGVCGETLEPHPTRLPALHLAGAVALGMSAEGDVHVSTDAGRSWHRSRQREVTGVDIAPDGTPWIKREREASRFAPASTAGRTVGGRWVEDTLPPGFGDWAGRGGVALYYGAPEEADVLALRDAGHMTRSLRQLVQGRPELERALLPSREPPREEIERRIVTELPGLVPLLAEYAYARSEHHEFACVFEHRALVRPLGGGTETWRASPVDFCGCELLPMRSGVLATRRQGHRALRVQAHAPLAFDVAPIPSAQEVLSGRASDAVWTTGACKKPERREQFCAHGPGGTATTITPPVDADYTFGVSWNGLAVAGGDAGYLLRADGSVAEPPRGTIEDVLADGTIVLGDESASWLWTPRGLVKLDPDAIPLRADLSFRLTAGSLEYSKDHRRWAQVARVGPDASLASASCSVLGCDVLHDGRRLRAHVAAPWLHGLAVPRVASPPRPPIHHLVWELRPHGPPPSFDGFTPTATSDGVAWEAGRVVLAEGDRVLGLTALGAWVFRRDDLDEARAHAVFVGVGGQSASFALPHHLASRGARVLADAEDVVLELRTNQFAHHLRMPLRPAAWPTRVTRRTLPAPVGEAMNPLRPWHATPLSSEGAPERVCVRDGPSRWERHRLPEPADVRVGEDGRGRCLAGVAYTSCRTHLVPRPADEPGDEGRLYATCVHPGAVETHELLAVVRGPRRRR